jgi:ATP-dependent Clp protease adaptor protein ClpS
VLRRPPGSQQPQGGRVFANDPDRRGPERDDKDGGTLTVTRTKQRLKRPRLYKVILHNDDYTPRSFVVMLLVSVFGKSESDANSIMLKAHNTGYSIAGVYPFSIAETKVGEVLTAAEKAGFPLMCSMEPEHDGDDDSGND